MPATPNGKRSANIYRFAWRASDGMAVRLCASSRQECGGRRRSGQSACAWRAASHFPWRSRSGRARAGTTAVVGLEALRDISSADLAGCRRALRRHAIARLSVVRAPASQAATNSSTTPSALRRTPTLRPPRTSGLPRPGKVDGVERSLAATCCLTRRQRNSPRFASDNKPYRKFVFIFATRRAPCRRFPRASASLVCAARCSWSRESFLSPV